jgi:superfamily II DNA or RNA helicase
LISPRFYQGSSIETVIQRFQKGVTRQLLSLATGLGKTICFGLLAKKLDTKTLVLAHRDELLTQAASKIRLVWPGVSIGFVKAERDEVDSQVVIASIQTACRPNRLARLKEQGFELTIIDEAHHSTGDSYKSVLQGLGFLENNPRKLLLGVTATPKRADGSGLDEIFQEISFHMGIKEGIEQGFLSPLFGRQILSRTDLRGIGTSCGDFIASELSQVVNTPSRNGLIVSSYQRFAEGRKKTLGFCVDVKHSYDLAIAFKAKGIASAAVHGAMPEEQRKQVLSDFAQGKIEVLLNCALLIEGFDQPEIDCLLLCRPTQSKPFYIQQIGRATRLHPSKANALILDFVDNSARHKLSSFASLEGAIKEIANEDERYESEPKEPKIKGSNPVEFAGEREIHFFEERQFAWNRVGQNWHLRVGYDCDVWVNRVGDEEKYDVAVNEKGMTTQLSKQTLRLEYATGTAEDWVRRQPKQEFARRDAGWRLHPASQKQVDALNKFGFQVDGKITKGEAASLLDSKFSEPATPKQISWLQGRGIEFPRSISKLQARKLIADKLHG